MIETNKYGYGSVTKTEYEITVLGPKGYYYVHNSRQTNEDDANKRFKEVCLDFPKKKKYKVSMYKNIITTETNFIKES